NAAKPHGQILDFRQQQAAVDAAIVLFSGVESDTKAREIWLVEPAPKVVEKLTAALSRLDDFLRSQGLKPEPESVPALRGDEARAAFVERFREVQRLKTQLDQYTDIPPEAEAAVERLLPRDRLNAFRGVYLETAQRLRAERDRDGAAGESAADQLDFEFVLFASADIDYDYIMALLARFSNESPDKLKMSRDQLIGLIQADAKFLDEGDTIADYVRTLRAGQGLDQKEIEAGYRRFRDERRAAELAGLARKHGLAPDRLRTFTDAILERRVFDGERLTELLEPRSLPWKDRRAAELALMEDLVPLLKKRVGGRDISGLSAYES
ncbi:MAG TPA: type I restriction endonuclease subunit R, partial [Spirochaetales bacterium]|nr:type I restriction endonuclease subunit R [Spirochaetales bacterium]